MSTLNLQQIEEQNRKAKQMNEQRNQMIGRQASARQEYERSAQVYSQKYGVTLAEDGLQEEYNSVVAAVRADAAAQAELIARIEAGDFQRQVEPVVVSAPAREMPTGAPVVVAEAAGKAAPATPTAAVGTPAGLQVMGGGTAVPTMESGDFAATGFAGVPTLPPDPNKDGSEPSETPFVAQGWED